MLLLYKKKRRIYPDIRSIVTASWGGSWMGSSANQVTPGSTSSEKERPGWGRVLPWPLIQWWRWPSGLTHPGGLPCQAAQASSASFPPRPVAALPSSPSPPAWQRQVLERGGKEVFWQFRLFLSRRFVSLLQYTRSALLILAMCSRIRTAVEISEVKISSLGTDCRLGGKVRH